MRLLGINQRSYRTAFIGTIRMFAGFFFLWCLLKRNNVQMYTKYPKLLIEFSTTVPINPKVGFLDEKFLLVQRRLLKCLPLPSLSGAL